jgi:hypothetical protein
LLCLLHGHHLGLLLSLFCSHLVHLLLRTLVLGLDTQ